MKDKSEFRISDNPTCEWVYIYNHRVKVNISYDEYFTFNISFHWAGKTFFKKLITTNNQKIYSSEDLVFDGIELHQIDRGNIAKRLNEILNINLS